MLFLIKEYWLAKYELNSSAFFLKSLIYPLFLNSGGKHGIFLPIRKLQNGPIILRTFTNVR